MSEDVLGRESADEVRARRQRQLEEKARIRALFKTVFGTPEGQLALYEIVKLSGALSVKERAEGFSQIDEGMRRMGIWISSYALGDDIEQKMLETFLQKK